MTFIRYAYNNLDMNYITRRISEKIKTLLANFPAVAVIGARQVGKTTLLRHIMDPDTEYVEFDPSIDIRNARKEPDLFLDSHTTPLILDEIQYAPELLGALKRRIDKNKQAGQYLISGSQQWGVLKSIGESLAGRVAIVELHGLDLGEASAAGVEENWIEDLLKEPQTFFSSHSHPVHPRFSIAEHVFRGGLPRAISLPLELIPDYLRSYFRTYIERDVRLLSDVSDTQLFGRFFRLAGALTAQEINTSQLGRDIGVSPQTGRRWLDLLSATFQWIEIPSFSQNTVKRISQKPKGYLSDSGLACFSLAISSPQALLSHPSWGALFETMTVLDLIKRLSTLNTKPNIYHWRAHSGAEIDLLLEYDDRYIPIEIKAGTHPSRSDTRGIKAFRSTYPRLNIQPGLVLCPCDHPYRLNDTDWAVPVTLP